MIAKLFSPRSAFAYIVLLVLSLFLFELPPWLLDIFLTVNLLLSLVLFLRGIFLKHPLELYSFPSVIVLTTLVRLALNVSSVKLILLHGDKGLDAAGKVIESFGSYVVQGDFIVGAIIFSIIAIINFVVVAKGSARVAEVAARFALDALPGRQMSIDADLRSGSLTKEEATEKRQILATESQFFGALDGAMKWVQGDAIAGLALAAINAIGGVAIGVSRGLPVAEAVSTFGVLTIGDGLVTIIPSLLVSLSAAILVARVSSPASRSTAEDIISQIIGGDRKELLIASQASLFLGFMGLLGLLPFPSFPFLLVGSALLIFSGAIKLSKIPYSSKLTSRFAIRSVNNLFLPLVADDRGDLVIEVSNRLVFEWEDSATVFNRSENSPSKSQSLLLGDAVKNFDYYEIEKSIDRICREIKTKYGFKPPRMSFAGNEELSINDFRIFIRGTLVYSGQIRVNEKFVILARNCTAFCGVEPHLVGEHPFSASKGFWASITKQQKLLETLKVEILTPIEYCIYQAIASVFDNLEMLFGAEEAKSLIRALNVTNPGLVDEVFKEPIISYTELAEIFRKLLKERIGIRDLKLILEGILSYASKNPYEENRVEWLSGLYLSLRKWSSQLIYQGILSNSSLRVFMLSSSVEEVLKEVIEEGSGITVLDMDFSERLKSCIINVTQPLVERGMLPAVVLCESAVRDIFQEFIFRQMQADKWLRVVSLEELPVGVRPELVSIINA